MVISHGKIVIPKGKLLKFRLANGTNIIPDPPLTADMAPRVASITIEGKEKWFGLVKCDQVLNVVGYESGAKKIQWYYTNMICPDIWSDTHELTFVVEKEMVGGQDISIGGTSPRSRIPVPVGFDTNSNLYAERFRAGQSKEFNFFDEAFRLVDKVRGFNHSDGIQVMFRLLAKQSFDGRIVWDDLVALFQNDADPSYYNAFEQIIQQIRRGIDCSKIKYEEVKDLATLCEGVLAERRARWEKLEADVQIVMKVSVELWESVNPRLVAMARGVEAIDDLASEV